MLEKKYRCPECGEMRSEYEGCVCIECGFRLIGDVLQATVGIREAAYLEAAEEE